MTMTFLGWTFNNASVRAGIEAIDSQIDGLIYSRTHMMEILDYKSSGYQAGVSETAMLGAITDAIQTHLAGKVLVDSARLFEALETQNLCREDRNRNISSPAMKNSCLSLHPAYVAEGAYMDDVYAYYVGVAPKLQTMRIVAASASLRDDKVLEAGISPAQRDAAYKAFPAYKEKLEASLYEQSLTGTLPEQTPRALAKNDMLIAFYEQYDRKDSAVSGVQFAQSFTHRLFEMRAGLNFDAAAERDTYKMRVRKILNIGAAPLQAFDGHFRKNALPPSRNGRRQSVSPLAPA